MKAAQIGIWPIFMMMALSVGLSNHVILLPVVLNESGRDAWLSAPLSFVIVLPWLFFIVHGIMKRTNQGHLREMLAKRVSKTAAWIVMLPIILLLLNLSFQTYSETIYWTSTTYLPATPPLVLQICLMSLIAYGVWSGIGPLTLMSVLLLPCVVFLGDFVMTANMPDKDYSYLLPILEKGPRGLARATFFSIGSLMELFVLLLIQHHFHVQMKKKHLFWILLFVCLLTVGPAIGAVTEFGPVEAAKLRYPAFAQWRLVTIGKYIEHLDFFAIFQWLSGAFIRVSISLYIVMELLAVKRQWLRALTLAILCMLYIAGFQLISRISINFMQFTKLVFLADVLVILTVTLVLWLLSFTKLRERGGEHAGSSRNP